MAHLTSPLWVYFWNEIFEFNLKKQRSEFAQEFFSFFKVNFFGLSSEKLSNKFSAWNRSIRNLSIEERIIINHETLRKTSLFLKNIRGNTERIWTDFFSLNSGFCLREIPPNSKPPCLEIAKNIFMNIDH